MIRDVSIRDALGKPVVVPAATHRGETVGVVVREPEHLRVGGRRVHGVGRVHAVRAEVVRGLELLLAG